jgi:sugar fermentation stimulation protein A
MIFENRLREGILVRRYKRFLADVKLKDGSVITVHCPNTGSMTNCSDPGSRVWFSRSNNEKRKYHSTLQIIQTETNDFVGINTNLANDLVVEAIGNNIVKSLAFYASLRREVVFGGQRSRIDLKLENSSVGGNNCFVEVKNVGYGISNGAGLFPDAITLRGQKHLRDLAMIRKSGERAVLLFCVQHSGIDFVRPADNIDPSYGTLLREAISSGVEVLAVKAKFDIRSSKICLSHEIPVVLS